MSRTANWYLNFFFALCLLIALCGPAAHAQSVGSVVNAASCQQSDVNAVINGPTHTAADGDTIQIPSGSCTWTRGIAVPANIGITIIGNGGTETNSGASATGASSACASATIITDQLSSGTLFVMSPRYGNSTSRISCMELLPTVPSSGFGSPINVIGTCTSSGCPGLRLDNITAPTRWSGLGISDDTFAIVANMWGVADHNTIGDVPSSTNGVDFVNVGDGNWLGVGSWGDKSWASPDTFGTVQAFYLENNTFNYAIGTDTDIGFSNGGGARLVCRFNTFNSVSLGTGCATHGTDTTGRARGARQVEDYGNTGICTNPSQGCPALFGLRASVTMAFGNAFYDTSTSSSCNTGFVNGCGFVRGIAYLDLQRAWRSDTPWGGCFGASPWDVNDGTTYYSGTISSVSGDGGNYTISVSGTPWSNGEWTNNGAPYSFIDVTQGSWGYEIGASTTGSITTFNTGSQYSYNVPATGDIFQILRATVCMDQPTHGAGLLVQDTSGTNGIPELIGTGTAGSVAEVLDPSYEFADYTAPSTGEYTMASDTQRIIANRDYYANTFNQAAQSSSSSPFNGATGTGYGTLANRPSTCTTGVGYFATDQGSWNTSGTTFPRQSFSQGELFVCTATNTWSLYYVPYTYPHPLEAGGGGGSSANSPAPPTNLSVTVK